MFSPNRCSVIFNLLRCCHLGGGPRHLLILILQLFRNGFNDKYYIVQWSPAVVRFGHAYIYGCAIQWLLSGLDYLLFYYLFVILIMSIKTDMNKIVWYFSKMWSNYFFKIIPIILTIFTKRFHNRVKDHCNSNPLPGLIVSCTISIAHSTLSLLPH